ncbi:MAG: superoxide dismutase family protein [Gammaproteobacteria bacterium]|nr:superoxide dismutase family protein [Gammaproteobacteria bacterium]
MTVPRQVPVRTQTSSCAVACLLAAATLAGVGAAAQPSASATLHACEGGATIGTATFQERPSGEGIKLVDVEVRVEGSAMAEGPHAVHIHETAACDPCGAAQGHFDPGPNSNTNPDGNHPFHSGDLVNLVVDAAGTGAMSTTTSRVTVSPGPLSILDEDGSALIIHVGADTYCPEGVVAGCAGGARAACGIIVAE